MPLLNPAALLRIEPQQEAESWLSLIEMSPPLKEKFQKAVRAYIQWIAALSGPPVDNQGQTSEDLVQKEQNAEVPVQQTDPALQPKNEKFIEKRKEELKDALSALQNEIFQKAPPQGFSSRRIRAEVFLNSFKPFRLAWIFYLLYLNGLCVRLTDSKRAMDSLAPLCSGIVQPHFRFGFALLCYVPSSGDQYV